ncbi:MAG: hypothetical protein DHS20C18_51720 [Saprospiraceae bacterium]|nr:MAG: hypothetical protein DHS20C18_51720 [Saprospiraceae bacterium]
MKSNVTAILCMLIGFTVFAQNNSAYNTLLKQVSFEEPTQARSAKGSPMLSEDWQMGSLQLPGQKEKIDLPMNLDLVHQLVVIRLNDDRTAYLTADKVNMISFNPGENEMIYKAMAIDSKGKIYFYQILKEGNFSFLQKTSKKLMSRNGGEIFGYDREYRVKGPDTDYQKISLSLESLKKGLPKYADHIDTVSKKMAPKRILVKEIIDILSSLEQRG